MKIKINRNCYRCYEEKEPERIKQPYCKKCHAVAMQNVRANTINIRIDIAKKIIDLIPDNYYAIHIAYIIERKERNLRRKLKNIQQ